MGGAPVNAFLAIADAQRHATSKSLERGRERRLAKLVVQSERDAPMVASPADKQAWENGQLIRRYKAALRQRRDDLENGPHGQEVKALLQLLDNLTASSAGALVGYVMHARWLRDADYNTRLDVLSLVGTAIARFRIRNGLPPFDDSLPPEPPTAFELVRHLLTGVGAMGAVHD